MSRKIEITQRAIADADAAFAWIAERSPQAAERWYLELFRQIETLAEHPHRCPLAAESPKFPEEVRELLYGRRSNYRILFTIRQDSVVVLTIHHASRDEAET